MTIEKKTQLAALNAQGKSIEEISKLSGVNAADVEAFLATRGAAPAVSKEEKAPEPKKRAYNRMTPTLLEKMKQLRSEGLTCAKIADQLGVNRKTVEYHLRNNATNTKKESPRGDKETGEQKMIKMTMQDTVKAAEQCADALGCQNCPLDWCKDCARHFANYIRIKEEEPAPVAADTDSEVRNSPNISTSDNTTETSRCQGLSGISGLGCLESALDEWLGLGQEAEIVSIEGDREKAYLRFLHDGQIYEMGFRRCRDV